MLRGVRKEYLKGTRRHFGPMFPVEKFLYSRVGLPWSEVHSELSQEFDRRTRAGYKFWSWFDRTVATNCWIGAETGKIYASDDWYVDQEVFGLYVHPFTGILSYRERPRKEPRPDPVVECIKFDALRRYEKIMGIWYYLEYRVDRTSIWGTGIPMISKKHQLNKKEMRRFNLTNCTQEEIVVLEEKAEAERKRLKELGLYPPSY